MRLLIAALLATSTLAHAEDLVFAGTVEPAGFKFYVDKDSIKRKINFVSLDLVLPFSATQSEKITLDIDCETKTSRAGEQVLSASQPMVWTAMGKQQSMSVTKVIQVACKKLWEFWK